LNEVLVEMSKISFCTTLYNIGVAETQLDRVKHTVDFRLNKAL